MALQTPCTLLVVDDDPGFLSALATLLRRDGHAVDTAKSGERALTQLQARRYDALLCDLQLSDLDGPTLYDIVRRQYPFLLPRVIFLTADVMRGDSLAFLEQCGQPWLAKPCPMAAVRRVLAQVLHVPVGASVGG
jgi:two-component system response regulator PilR (NtrC family)